MEAKQLQLGSTALVAVAIAYVGWHILGAVRDGRPAVRWRSPGVLLAAAGCLTFVLLGWTFLSPPPGWESSDPKDVGYRWFLFVPAALLAAVTVLAAIRPRQAGRLLLGIVGGLAVVGGALGVAFMADPGRSSEGAVPALVATTVGFALPALVTGLVLFDAERSPSPGTGHQEAN
ncbi:MAG TPA: hypothetical protein VF763_11460 [Candidatus Limnocylindrales bacterium]